MKAASLRRFLPKDLSRAGLAAALFLFADRRALRARETLRESAQTPTCRLRSGKRANLPALVLFSAGRVRPTALTPARCLPTSPSSLALRRPGC